MLLVVACGGDDEAVEFEEGRIPDSVPRDFPVPEGAVIGATMVDPVNSRTEFSLTVESELPSLVQFFTISLVNQGYVIERSQGTSQTSWHMSFRRGDLSGEILVSSDGARGSQAIVILDVV
jgi:hypothetical protein